jgi:hypothetical protein
MNFGKYSIITGIQHNFEEEPDWYWKINPVTAGMELDMSKFLAHRRIVNAGGQRLELPPTSMEIAFREIALTFGGSNIPKEVDRPVGGGGEPLLKEDAPVEDIEAVLRHFPSTMLMEIWRAVGESYPSWGPANPN